MITEKGIYYAKSEMYEIFRSLGGEYGYNEHLGADKKHYIIKNKFLASELERKLFRILAYENASKNYFRQHITDVKNYLISEMK